MKRLSMIVALATLTLFLGGLAGCNCREQDSRDNSVTEEWADIALRELGMTITVPPQYKLSFNPDPTVLLEASNAKNQTWIVVRAAQWEPGPIVPSPRAAEPDQAAESIEGETAEQSDPLIRQLTDYAVKRPENMEGTEQITYWTTMICDQAALSFNGTSMERNRICYGKERLFVRNNQVVNMLFCSGSGPLTTPYNEWADVVLNSAVCDESK